MRLVELAANKSSFKTIPFNREGLSLIVGARTRPIDAALDKTYNGVGKSLALVLVHFCLGSNKIPAFEVNLPDWEFQLTFESAGVTHRVMRRTGGRSFRPAPGYRRLEMPFAALQVSAPRT